MKKVLQLLTLTTLLTTSLVTTSIHDAVRRGELSTVKNLIKSGVDIHEKSKILHGMTPLHITAACNKLKVVQQWGGVLHVSPSGHSIIKKEMARCNALLAGELSCHFFFHDRYFGYDDGIYAMLRLFEILHETNQSLDELLTVFPPMFSSPEIRIACAEEQKVALIEQVHNFFEHKSIKELITIDGVRVHTDYGWGLARASNTQPVMCFRFESETQDGLQKITNDFLEAIQPYYDADVFEQTTH